MSKPETKECPYCAEIIRANARICRYCQRELTPPPAASPQKKQGKSKAPIAILIVLILIACLIYFAVSQSPSDHNRPRATNAPRAPSKPTTARVLYAITGDGVTAVSVTWENDTGGTDQSDYKVPFAKEYDDFQRGDFVYISAQIIQPTSGAGSIECRILVDGELIYYAEASGFASIAKCSGKVP